MNCLWCQNPEGIKPGQAIWWEERKCIRCLACMEACPADSVVEDESGLHIEWSKCTLCGACVEACPSLAMAFTSQEWTIDSLVKEALKDKDYYQAFGGGVTVSGGEPLNQFKFVTEFFRALKEEGINTALDTCGLAQMDAFDSVLPYTDYVLYDVKILNPELHRKYTGQSNKIILDNLLRISEDYLRNSNNGRKLWIRTPLIPDATATEENIAEIGRFIHDNILDVVERWELCSFNNACSSKYKKMGQTWILEDTGLMAQNDIDKVKAAALSVGIPRKKLVISGLIAR